MNKILSFLLFLFFLILSGKPSFAASPVGYIGRADQDQIDGWARDDDNSGTIYVDIYADNQFKDRIKADKSYCCGIADGHGFYWTPTNLSQELIL